MSATAGYRPAELAGALRVAAHSGKVRISAGPGDEIVVERGVARLSDGRLEVQPDRGVVDVVVPEGTDVVVGTTSARVELIGALGSVAATTASGRIELERARTADLRTRSAPILAGTVQDRLRVETSSGRIEVAAAATLEASTVSGRLVCMVGERAAVRSVSGRVELVVRSPEPDIGVETVAGRVDVTVPAQARPRLQLVTGGRLRADLPDGDLGEVRVRSVSGNVSVERLP